MKRMLAIRKECTDIICPLIRGGLVKCLVTRVTMASPLPLRKAVWRHAQFFRREFHFDFEQYGYEGRETNPNHVAFLWIHPESVGMDDDWLAPIIGACCFRLREGDERAYWALQWIWMHPFFRRRGLLQIAWPDFCKEFGGFICEPPLSDAMKAFLAKNQPSGREARIHGSVEA
jgi:GNAT superfamily N-acetyltransferase